MAVDPVTPDFDRVVAKPSWLPTRKWLAGTGLGLITILLVFVSEGSVDFTNGLEGDEWAVLGILVQRVVTYLLENKATLTGTGVPAAREGGL
jgi:hypothetical protein